MPKDTEDLFDNVKLPKEKDAEPQPAAPMREAAPAQAPQRAGAPLSRLLWLVVPLLAVVAAVALWSVSWWLVIVALGALAVGLVITAAVRNWQRRRPGGSSRPGTVLSSSRPSGRFGLGRSGSGRTGRDLGSLGSKRGTGTGIGTGSGRTGRGLFKRGTGRSGRGRSGTAGTGAASVGRTGRARTGGRPVRGGRIGSLLSSGRRGARAAKTGTGRSAAEGTGASRRSGRGTRSSSGGTGLRGGKWTTSRANPKTWAGERRRAAQAVRAATKNRRRGKGRTTKDTAGGKQPQSDTGAKRPFWKPWQAKTYTKGGEPISNTENTSKTPAKKPDVKRPDVKAPKKNGDSKSPSTAVPSGTAAKPKKPTLDDFPFDFEDRGFADWQSPKPAPKPVREFDFDDMGFPSPTTQPKAKPATNSTQRSTIMPNQITNIPTAQTDASSPQTFRATTQEAASQLRQSAGEKQEQAGALRAQAQTWIENGENSTGERLLREAAALEQDAGRRVAAAAAYEDVAASVQ